MLGSVIWRMEEHQVRFNSVYSFNLQAGMPFRSILTAHGRRHRGGGCNEVTLLRYAAMNHRQLSMKPWPDRLSLLVEVNCLLTLGLRGGDES
jgi:hypothetical protein